MIRTILALLAATVSLVIIVPILLGALLLKCVAGITKALSGMFGSAVASWDESIKFDQRIGWKNRPNLKAYVPADEPFYVTTDADGWRGQSSSLLDSDIVVFGDSHAFGHGIDEEHHFGMLNQSPRIKAIGSDGYNGVQQLLCMEEIGSRLQNKLVVWFVFPGNDLLDNLEPSMMHYRTPFVRRVKGGRDWEIVTSHVSAEPWPLVSRRYKEVNYDRLTKVFCPSFVSERAFSACEFLIEQATELCRRVGARLVVFTVPDPTTMSRDGLRLLYAHGAKPETFDPGLPDKMIGEICRKSEIPFVRGAECLSVGDYKTHDAHWNRLGHRKVANMLATLYRKHGVMEKRSMAEMAQSA